MGTLGSKVDELRLQDDLRSRAISELAEALNVDYKEAEVKFNLMVRQTIKQVLNEVAICKS